MECGNGGLKSLNDNLFFFSSRRRHTRFDCDWSSDVCSSDLDFMKTCSGMGLAGTLFPGVLWAQARAEGAKKITKEMIESAAAIADVPISEEYKEMMLENLNDHGKGYEEIYKLHIPNSVDPALIFDPLLPGMKFETCRKPLKIFKAGNSATVSAPKNLEDLAFANVRVLSELVRTLKVSSFARTVNDAGRLQMYVPRLTFGVTPS